SDKDMQKYSITYEKMDYNDRRTRQAIIKLLYKVRNDINYIDISKSKIFIEAFPTEEGGCVLYLNILCEIEKEKALKNNFDTPIIAEIKDLDTLTSLCKNMLNRCYNLILKSNLYYNNNKFIITVYSYCKQDNKLLALLSEHGEIIGKGNFASSLIAEHFKLIIKGKAIETVTNYLAKY
ncbi:MAG: adaptor protein MecA, partial [Oscillospiraceae bacterium]|nr:adaptor protein MecA [Oscillospiraceae bacterium]